MKSKKIIAIICALTMVVTIFGSLTAFAAADVPASTVTMSLNEDLTTDTQIAVDVTTDAQYVTNLAIYIDVSGLYSYIPGTSLIQKKNAVKAASNIDDRRGQGFVDTGKDLSQQLYNANFFKFSFSTSDDNPAILESGNGLIGTMVIPLSTALTDEVSLSFAGKTEGATYAYMVVGCDDPEDTVLGIAYERHGEGDAGTVADPLTYVGSPIKVGTATPVITVGDAAKSGTKLTWAVTVPASLMTAGNVKAQLINTSTSAVGAVETLEWAADLFTGDGDASFNVITNLLADTYVDATDLKISSGSVSATN